MAEKIVSPGVFTQENDLSFLPAGIGEIGAAFVGPTVKGPVGVPTVVSSYSEFQSKFGSVFKSGSAGNELYYNYLTANAVNRYMQNSGVCTIVRVDGAGYASAQGSALDSHLTRGGNLTGSAEKVVYALAGGAQNPTNAAATNFRTNGSASFTLHTLSHGVLLNNSGSIGTNCLLTEGTNDNLRWEVTAVNNALGTFSVLVRKGNDTLNQKNILETWSGVSLDPNATNYIAKVIGDSTDVVRGTDDEPYIQSSGSYKNNSLYVRVEVHQQTIDYLDDNGGIRLSAASASLPTAMSGTFHSGADGSRIGGAKYNEDIIAGNSQGYDFDDLDNGNGGAALKNALNLLKNQDFYDINMLIVPGINQKDHGAAVDKVVSVCETRGDCFTVIDPVGHDQSVTVAYGEADDYNSSYAAMYWPWVQISDNELGKNVWVPPSVVMPGVMAYNDTVAAEWYAPAGLNRGGIQAYKAERNLTHTDRDNLYENRVNPIATFPGVGVCAWGQKTLQKRPSALDRINVRRLLINLKKFIASTTKYLVFEQNTTTTRNRFLSTVVPYMEEVQANQGLYAFRVVMDATNNTPEVIDRNIMKGDIFIQPARAAEFIVIDFNIMPTGATFND